MWKYYKCPQCPIFHFKPNKSDTSEFENHIKHGHSINKFKLSDYEVKNICPVCYNHYTNRGKDFWKRSV